MAYISPLTYYTDIARGSIGDGSYFSLIVSMLAILGFGILFFVLAVFWHKRTLSKRF